MHVTRAVLFVYRELDVRLDVGGWRRRRFHHQATEQEIADALWSFDGFSALVTQLSDGAAAVECEVVQAERTLTSLTRETPARFWPSPNDTRIELDRFAPAGVYDSVFVFWPQRDSLGERDSVPSDAWGLALPANARSNGATYAAVTSAPTPAWHNEARGEVWLHEWLHGVCGGYAAQGHPMPQRDADGAELHGYARSPVLGWTGYYRDLMTANVIENGARVGIPKSAWRTSYASRNPARRAAA